MSFVSAAFLLFVAVVLLAYYLIPLKYRYLVLLVASYIFYFMVSGKLILYILFTTVSSFLFAIAIEHFSNIYTEQSKSLSKEERKQLKKIIRNKKRILLTICLVIKFGVLVVLKYSGSVISLLQFFGFEPAGLTLDLLLPVGISFYTFQTMGYLIDVYRGKYSCDRNILKYAVFVSFFPQIVQGPISRHDQLASQLYEGNRLDYKNLAYGAQMVLWGFFKKLVIADRASVFVDTIFNANGNYDGFYIIAAVLMYSFQLYCDFSGGIDIAAGVAEMMGIHLTPNFLRPNFSNSLPDFWRRWHITLGTWCRDYIFYPISLSKAFTQLGKKSRKVFGNYIGKMLPVMFAQFLVFLVIGLWHGSSFKYVAFGLYHGTLINLGILMTPFNEKVKKSLHINDKDTPFLIFQVIRTFIIVNIGRYFSRAPSFLSALAFFKASFHFNPISLVDGSMLTFGVDGNQMTVLLLAILVLFIVGLLQEKGIHIRDMIEKTPVFIRWPIYFCSIFVVLIFGYYGFGYNSSAFIYMGF